MNHRAIIAIGASRGTLRVMATKTNTVRKLLAELQHLSRIKISDDEGHAMSFRLPSDLIRPETIMLFVTEDLVEVLSRAREALAGDLHFEHMEHTTDTLQDFIARAWADEKTDQVQKYVDKYSRKLLELICFLPLEYLTVETPTLLL
jgi:hypothetical protein